MRKNEKIRILIKKVITVTKFFFQIFQFLVGIPLKNMLIKKIKIQKNPSKNLLRRKLDITSTKIKSY